jgi:hypothetical protein
MRIPKFILGLLLSSLISVMSWAGLQLLEVKDRVTRLETRLERFLPAAHAGVSDPTNQLAKIIR